MQKVSRLRKSKTQKEFFQYFFVGGTAAIVDVGMFSLFSQVFLIDYRIAIVLAFTFGVFANFSLCNWIVFVGKRKPLWLVFVRHYVSSLSVLVVNEIVMISLVEFFNFEKLVIAKIMSTGAAFIINFFLKKRYVYNDAYYKGADKHAPLSNRVQRRSQK